MRTVCGAEISAKNGHLPILNTLGLELGPTFEVLLTVVV
jgi:hypothetical protein